MIYQVRFTKEAKKDIAKLTPKLKQKLKEIEIKLVLIPMEVKN
jgi:mRNA-degrading endonuclease RelE of RelBE toxin-antitoxin system